MNILWLIECWTKSEKQDGCTDTERCQWMGCLPSWWYGGLGAAAQRHKIQCVLYHISLAWEKIKGQNSKNGSTKCTVFFFFLHHKTKNSYQTTVSREPSIQQQKLPEDTEVKHGKSWLTTWSMDAGKESKLGFHDHSFRNRGICQWPVRRQRSTGKHGTLGKR